jgi:hypothetical protein
MHVGCVGSRRCVSLLLLFLLLIEISFLGTDLSTFSFSKSVSLLLLSSSLSVVVTHPLMHSLPSLPTFPAQMPSFSSNEHSLPTSLFYIAPSSSSSTSADSSLVAISLSVVCISSIRLTSILILFDDLLLLSLSPI